MDESGGWREGEAERQKGNEEAMETNESNFLGRVATHISTFVRACVRARTRHGPMTSIHFHARMENSGAGERGMETEGRGRKLTRDKRYFSRRGVKESSFRTSVFQDESLKKKKEADELKTN